MAAGNEGSPRDALSARRLAAGGPWFAGVLLAVALLTPVKAAGKPAVSVSISSLVGPVDNVGNVVLAPQLVQAIGTSQTHGGAFSPTSGAGTYAFSARLRNATTGMASLWSPETSIAVR